MRQAKRLASASGDSTDMSDAEVASRRGSSTGGSQDDDDDNVEFEPFENETNAAQNVALRRSEHEASAV